MSLIKYMARRNIKINSGLVKNYVLSWTINPKLDSTELLFTKFTLGLGWSSASAFTVEIVETILNGSENG